MSTSPSGSTVDHTEVVGAESARVNTLEERFRRDPFDPIAAARLEAIHAARGDFEAVARLVADRGRVLVDPAERARALCRAAVLTRVELCDPQGARSLAEEALAACPDEPRVAAEMEALAGQGDEVAREVCERLARAATECELGAPELASTLWLEIAAIELTARMDPAQALAALGRVAPDAIGERGGELLDRLERDATDTAFLEGLADLCRRGGDLERQRRILVRTLEMSDPGERAHRHRALASLLAERGDQEGARWYAHEADRLDPLSGPGGGDLEHERDAALLAERYAREQRWHDLEPVIDRLVRRGGLAAERLGLSRADLHYHAGRAALELGKYDKAVHHYGEALEFEPAHLAALIERARAAAGCDRWDAAHDLYGQALLVQRSEGRPARELADTLFRMGEAREKTGLLEAALTLYQAALDAHPTHAGALAAGCRLHRAAGDLVATERLLRVALDRLEGAPRVETLIELAHLRGRFFADAETAAAACREARALAPDERRVLLAFVEHCFAAGEAEDAIAALDQLASAEPSHLERGKYHQLAAVLVADRSVDQAVRLFHAALNCFFAPHRMPPAAMRGGCMVAFREIDRLLRGKRHWKRLEREYRAMIKRLPSDAAELPRLWADLGAIYRTHLGHGEAAIQSFEVAAALEKDRLTHHRILIDLYQGFQSDELDKLIERRKKLLAAEPFNHEHYSALRALWTKTKERDRTYTACRALVLLGRADRSEVAFFRRFRPGGVVWPRRGLTPRDWARLRHPNEDPLVSAIMGLCAEPVALLSAMTARRMRICDDESISHEHVRHFYRQVAGALGVGSPAVFVMPEMLGDVVLANLRRGQILTPAFAIGCHMYQGRSNAQMVQALARALSYARPSAYLRLLLGGQTGSGKLLAAVWAAARATAVRGATQGVSLDGVASDMQAALQRRAHRGAWLAELRGALHRVRERVDVPVDLEHWGRAVDVTARRAGLLLSGDLKAAAADLSREPLFAQKVKRERRLADLLVHSVSDEHQEMRSELGLAVD